MPAQPLVSRKFTMFTFLLIVQTLIAASLVAVILMQRSEGGGLGVGGSSSGFMTARGAADFLTRTTKWLAVVFVVLAIVMAAVAVKSTTGGDTVDTSLQRTTLPPAGAQPKPAPAPAPAAPADNDPLKNVAQ
jgi:preprotein translocase subunit SecG